MVSPIGAFCTGGPSHRDLDPSLLQSVKNLSSDGAGAGGGRFL